MNFSRFALIAVFATLLAAPALAQTDVQISADTFTIEEGTKEAVFVGNVVIKHPTVNVWADKVVATYGDGGTSDIKSFEATGKVKLETDEQTATGDRAVFSPGDQLLRLTGNVEVSNAAGSVNAQELVVNLATNVSTFTASEGGRVTGVFTTQ
ncbi:MAG: LptA/OstA family protein [Devosia sp.]|uniref:LptA/OstA family protein n=1 Tax=Devosia sp. TaxID=1871048 RepID=UPI003397873F